LPLSNTWCADSVLPVLSFLWGRGLVAGRSGGEGGVAHSDSPRHCVSRVNGYRWAGGTQRSWRAAVRRGRTNYGLTLTCRECGGSGEESGDTLSARRSDLKTLVVLISSATRLAYAQRRVSHAPWRAVVNAPTASNAGDGESDNDANDNLPTPTLPTSTLPTSTLPRQPCPRQPCKREPRCQELLD
jgi:hypothetical protein